MALKIPERIRRDHGRIHPRQGPVTMLVRMEHPHNADTFTAESNTISLCRRSLARIRFALVCVQQKLTEG